MTSAKLVKASAPTLLPRSKKCRRRWARPIRASTTRSTPSGPGWNCSTRPSPRPKKPPSAPARCSRANPAICARPPTKLSATSKPCRVSSNPRSACSSQSPKTPTASLTRCRTGWRSSLLRWRRPVTTSPPTPKTCTGPSRRRSATSATCNPPSRAMAT